ncbi:MAG: YceI family protein [Anaerolineae bacterium]|nr:YceI family protein [Anaerolineae bacterium]
MTWNIDYSHSQLTFTARHMMITKVRGRFEDWAGVVNYDEENPTNTTVDITIQAASINSKEEQRDRHLRSGDFFDVEKYPVIRFKSKRVEQDDANSGRLIGDLTIRDVTKEVALDVEYGGTVKNPWGATVAAFSAATTINRKDWGLTWNVALEAGGWLVSDKITIEIDLQLQKVAQPEEELVAA